jgi:hypothetical protein
MSLATTIADAIVTALNAAVDDDEFSLSFAAERRYLPIRNLADLETLSVSVVLKGVDYAQFTRGKSQRIVQVDIAVQKKYDTEANTELDPLLALSEEIADYFEKTARQITSAGTVVKVDHNPIYVQQHLEEFRVFSSIVTLTIDAYVNP